jgi:hypothetical protein
LVYFVSSIIYLSSTPNNYLLYHFVFKKSPDTSASTIITLALTIVTSALRIVTSASGFVMFALAIYTIVVTVITVATAIYTLALVVYTSALAITHLLQGVCNRLSLLTQWQ